MKDGDAIAFDYELWVEGRDTLYDTTLRDAAEKAGTLDPAAHYGPMHYVLGFHRVIPGLERALRESVVGSTTEVTVPPEEAYGARDPKLIETLPIREFRKNEVDPEPGLAITYRNRRGVVTTVGGGRVRVDFNPPLAGKTLKYRFTLRAVAQSAVEKARFVIAMDYPNPFDWDVTEDSKEKLPLVTVKIPDAVHYDRNWILGKLRIVTDLARVLPGGRVRFLEEYALRLPEEPAAPLVEKPA